MSKYTWMPKFVDITVENPNHTKLWQEGMDWARLEIDTNSLKAEFVKWANTHIPTDAEKLALLPAWHFLTLGRVACLINNGAAPADVTVSWFDKQVAILNALSPPVEDTDLTESDDVFTSKDKRVIEYVNLYSYIDAIRVKFSDDGDAIEEKIKQRLHKTNANRLMLRKLYTHFKDSLTGAMADRNNPYVEPTIAPLVLVVNILAGASGNATVAAYKGGKADRKAVKAAENVNYKTMDAATNMASVNPAQVPGSTLVIVYNTKDRKAQVYYAKSGETINIKGTKLINFDEVKSFAKTLRNPKQILPGVRDAVTTRRIDVIFEDINGKNHTVNGRISKEMVIVKVFK